MTRHLLCGLASMLLTAASSAAELRLTATFPERVTDGDPLVATATLTNTSPAPQRVITLQPLRTLRSDVELVERYPSDKCTASQHYTPAHVDMNYVEIAPGDSTRAEIDIGAGYPLGLIPGRYRLRLAYAVPGSDEVVSAPIAFEVIPPALSPQVTVYQEFIKVCRALSSRERVAADLALDFARTNPAFPYTRSLLNLIRQQAREEARIAIDDLLIRCFPGSHEAEAAASDRERLMARSETLKQYQAYLTALQIELEKPENAELTRAFRRLPSITKPEDFPAYEAFLARYPRSPFRDEVIHRMIVAVEQGVTPAGRTQSDARKDLYASLLAGDSYWAERARSQEASQNLRLRQ